MSLHLNQQCQRATLCRPGPYGSGHRLCRLRQARNGARPDWTVLRCWRGIYGKPFWQSTPCREIFAKGVDPLGFRVCIQRGTTCFTARPRPTEIGSRASVFNRQMIDFGLKKGFCVKRSEYRRASLRPHVRCDRYDTSPGRRSRRCPSTAHPRSPANGESAAGSSAPSRRGPRRRA